MPRISFQPIADSWTLVLLLLAAMAIAAALLSRAKDKGETRKKRRFELALRFAALALFACLFTRPAIVTTEKEELPASVVFLCDDSQSMSVCDEQNGQSRYEAMLRAFEESSDSFRALCDKFDVRAYAFSDDAKELEIADGKIAFPTEPTGKETKLGDALTDALRAATGKRLLAAIVLSDGAQRAKDVQGAVSAQDAALKMRDAERIVHTVPFGSENVAGAARDAAILDLRANDRVFLGNEFTASGQVRLLGCEGLQIPLTLSLETEPGKMEVVGETTLVPDSADDTIAYQFNCKPETPGKWKLRVACPVQEHELVASNNEIVSFVEALDRGVNVLYIEGTRRYEQNFIRAALDEASDVRIKYWRPSTASLVAKSPNKKEAEMVAQYARSRKPIDKTFFSEGKYAAYVLGDVDATAFQPNELKALTRQIEDGAGLIVLGAERSLSLGGYSGTPLEKALPVQLSEADRLPLESDLAEFDAQTADSQKMRFDALFAAEPTQEGGDDFITRLSLDPKKNLAAWAKLPTLNSLYRLGKVKPSAKTLLTARQADASGKPIASGKPYPLLVTQQYGLGRVAVLGTDSTWRWRMRGAQAEHSKFWRQLLLWASKFDELLEGELAAELERSRFATDETVEFRAAYRPKPGEDPSKFKARASVVAPDGKRETIELTEENGHWRGLTRRTSVPGDYLIEVELLSPTGETLQTAQARFLAYEQNLELERPEANPGALRALAATTDGQTFAPKELNDLLDELLRQRETIADYREVKRGLCETWTFFAIFVCLAALDWILRKRWGMV